MKYLVAISLKDIQLFRLSNHFIERNKVKEFTVVADAAMISSENITQLTQNNINYIVGARLGNISTDLLKIIDKKWITRWKKY